MQVFINWHPSQGQLVPGAVVSEQQFVGAMPVALLLLHVRDPRRPERGVDQEDPLWVDDADEHAAALPSLEGAKRRNVRAYAQYILKATAREMGTEQKPGDVLPPIVLWSALPLSATQTPSTSTALVLPHDTQFDALDGRTQVAAWHEIATQYPERRKVLVPVVIHHGRSPGWAQQAFRDIHTLAIKPNMAAVDGIDTDDPISVLARQLEESVELFKGRIGRERQIRSQSQDVLTWSTLRTACATFAIGISGVQQTLRPSDAVDAADNEHVRSQSVRWFRAVSNRFEGEFQPKVRKESVLPSPAAMAAVGAFGHPLIVKEGPAAQDLEWRIDRLAEINWRRGPHWDGIAGKLTPTGTLSLGGGAREHAYDILRALEDQDSDEYRRVRNQQQSWKTG